jgi:aryl-alcohol dehydrogenase-like predicted oxidoreductase
MTMGWTSGKDDSFAVMDYAFENGINFFDTADIYSFWADNNDGGIAETWIGEWLKKRGVRDEIVIATKVRGRMWGGPDGEGLGHKHILRAVEDSLRRLQIETIDLYQSHWPDDSTPLEETFLAFEALVQQGKVRFLGCSNHSPDQLQDALDTSARLNVSRYESLQPHYNLVHRQEYEVRLMGMCADKNLGVIPYSPLAGGFLTGKYHRRGGQPTDSRGYGNNRMRPYMTAEGFDILDALARIGSDYNATTSQTALAWLLANPTVTSAIVGANSVTQLVETMKAIDIKLSDTDWSELNNLPSPT